jgi:dTDP-4-dehydrorhamnose reductase
VARSVRRVAVIGAGGQLGSDIVLVLEQAPDFEVVPLFHRDVEVTDAASVQAALDAARCDVVVNCAAFHRVDECEERADEAFRVNAIGAWNVARACARLGAQCVFVSTDYVFSGEKGSPYVEDDRPDPINVYGLSKAAGEWLVRNTCPDAIVLRQREGGELCRDHLGEGPSG